ncbi:MAG: methanogen output domain 1-containing protein [Magnetospirillum sp.]|nr:methanogen output domain 1-containing protein [Magnetospirillum sp.]
MDAERMAQRAAAADIPLDPGLFMRTLIRELADVLGDVVGIEQASGFISIVGRNMGQDIDQSYRRALNVPTLSREQVAAALVDLKRRIGGDFFIIEQSDDKIVLGNRACPFKDKVIGQKAMCMMTSNIFGSIAADNLGYAKVHLVETIAEGRPQCRVAVYLRISEEADAAEGREYFCTAAESP